MFGFLLRWLFAFVLLVDQSRNHPADPLVAVQHFDKTRPPAGYGHRMTLLSYHMWLSVKSVTRVLFIGCLFVSLLALLDGVQGVIACILVLLLLGVPPAGLYAEAFRRVQACEDHHNCSYRGDSHANL